MILLTIVLVNIIEFIGDYYIGFNSAVLGVGFLLL